MKLSATVIIIISIFIPLAISALYLAPKIDLDPKYTSFLPTLNAIVNGSTTVILVLAFLAIRRGNRKLHMRLMMSALILSIVFLISYLTYHSSTEETKFGGEGAIRYVYYFILLTHILLAGIIVPLVLLTLNRALTEKFDKHRKIARITLPIWLYVSTTGVLVYLLISPYYS